MATRTATRAVASASSSPAPARRSLAIAQPASAASPQLVELRRQWKWAAFSQFFYTFAQLIALEDVSLVDVEDDLVDSTMIVIPRLMQRLLVTLSQDRKITVENWQSALRRQYSKRDPAANPIGIEPVASRTSRAATVDTEIKSEERDSVLTDDATNPGVDDRGVLTEETKIPDVADNENVEETHANEANDAKAIAPLDTSDDITKDEEGEFAQNAQGSLKDWADISMLEKLESIHTLIEWHFQSPLRLRSIMRSDDDNATWRIGPIGYDAKRNAYWLIGSDRLWIQRVAPKPSKKSGKRKATSSVDTRRSKAPRIEQAKGGRKVEANTFSQAADTSNLNSTGNTRTPRRNRRGARRPPAAENILPSPPLMSGRARAAKTQANVMLDLQAKQLAAAKAEMQSFSRRSTARNSPAKPSGRPTLGTRVSRRLRGDDDDDEWQQIPEEWLSKSEGSKSKSTNSPTNGSTTRTSTRNKAPPRPWRHDAAMGQSTTHGKVRNIGLDSDNESDLTELSDSDLSTHQDDTVHVNEPSDLTGVAPEHENIRENDQPSTETLQTPDFIEWETLCVSLQEWEAIAHRFEKATHYLEKALHKILVQEVVPFVTESLREIERQRIKEDALMNRKRSSRIAVKETEKEVARLAAARQAEEDEKMARMKRLEARTRREEDERLQREQAREQRRKEREERELARSRRLERKSVEADIDVSTKVQSNDTVSPNKILPSGDGPSKPSRRRPGKRANKQSTSGDNWELDCEVCGSKGINRDDGVPLMSCGKCNKWQHITCHDAVDRKAGRPLRDWDAVDFFCKRCLAFQNGNTDSSYPIQTFHAPLAINGHGRHSDNQPATTAQMYGASVSTNGFGENKMSVQHQQSSPESTAFAGFAHYHPHQRGFSPHPSALQPQHQFQSRELVHSSFPSQSSAAHINPAAWDSRAQTSAFPGQVLNQGTFPLSSFPPSQNVRVGTRDGPSSEHQQSYPIASNGSVPHQSTHVQAVQYSHTYSLPPQQGGYGNPASYHP